jgi:hypothetical protein
VEDRDAGSQPALQEAIHEDKPVRFARIPEVDREQDGEGCLVSDCHLPLPLAEFCQNSGALLFPVVSGECYTFIRC